MKDKEQIALMFMIMTVFILLPLLFLFLGIKGYYFLGLV